MRQRADPETPPLLTNEATVQPYARPTTVARPKTLGYLEGRKIDALKLFATLQKPSDEPNNHTGILTIKGKAFACRFSSATPITTLRLNGAKIRNNIAQPIREPLELLRALAIIEHDSLPERSLRISIARQDLEAIDRLTR